LHIGQGIKLGKLAFTVLAVITLYLYSISISQLSGNIIWFPIIRKRLTEERKDYPHYRIQYWDDFSICWVNIYVTSADPQRAENFALMLGKKYLTGKKYRIMEVTRNGQNPVKTN
jgi:hypothetical protein